MTTVRRLMATFAGALLLPLVLAVPAHTKGSDVWITIERAAAEPVLADLGAAGSDGALTVEGDGNVVVAHLSEADLPYLSERLHRDLGHCGGFIAHSSRQAALDEAARANHRETPPAPQLAYTIDNGPVVNALLSDIQEINIRNTIISLSDFFTRFHNCDTGRQSARSIYEALEGLRRRPQRREDPALPPHGLQHEAAVGHPHDPGHGAAFGGCRARRPPGLDLRVQLRQEPRTWSR